MRLKQNILIIKSKNPVCVKNVCRFFAALAAAGSQALLFQLPHTLVSSFYS